MDRSTWVSAAKLTTASQPVGNASDQLGVGDVSLDDLDADVLEVRSGSPRRSACRGRRPPRPATTRRLTKWLPMNPQPPVTRMRITRDGSRRAGPRPGSTAAARGTRGAPRASAAGWASRGCLLRRTEYAGLGAGRSSSSLEIGTTRQASPASAKIAAAKSAHEHSPCAARWYVPNGSSSSALVAPREVPDVGGAAHLVGDDAYLVPFGAEAQHRPQEVVARRAEEPRRAHDPAVPDLQLARQLRLAVDRSAPRSAPTRRRARERFRRRRSPSSSRRPAPRARRPAGCRGR